MGCQNLFYQSNETLCNLNGLCPDISYIYITKYFGSITSLLIIVSLIYYLDKQYKNDLELN